MSTQPASAHADQRLPMIEDIINTLSRKFQWTTKPSERDELLAEIAYFNLYRRSVMSDITTNHLTATYGNRSTSVNE